MKRPTVLAYGMGVDSTALLVELEARGEAPDLVLTARTKLASASVRRCP